MSDTNSRYPNLRLSGTPDRLGRVQKQRAFIASGGKPLRMADLLPRSYPRATTFKKWHRTNVHSAVVKVAVRISKTGRGLECAPRCNGNCVGQGPKPVQQSYRDSRGEPSHQREIA